MVFDTKIAVVLRDDLPVWQQLNVTAFIISGIAGTVPGVIGENYEDASGNQYLPMIIQPIMIFGASGDQLRNVYQRALSRKVKFSIFTEELFVTGYDEENRTAVKGCTSEEMKLVGMAMRDDKKIIDKIIQGLALHK